MPAWTTVLEYCTAVIITGNSARTARCDMRVSGMWGYIYMQVAGGPLVREKSRPEVRENGTPPAQSQGTGLRNAKGRVQ